jgi:hypothetical protein
MHDLHMPMYPRLFAHKGLALRRQVRACPGRPHFADVGLGVRSGAAVARSAVSIALQIRARSGSKGAASLTSSWESRDLSRHERRPWRRSAQTIISDNMRGPVESLLKRRHKLEATVILMLAVVAVCLEVSHIETVFERDPFRIILPALTALVALTLLELVAVVAGLAEFARELEVMRKDMQNQQAGSKELDRLSSGQPPRVQRRGNS